jgi:hypothetical protein
MNVFIYFNILFFLSIKLIAIDTYANNQLENIRLTFDTSHKFYHRGYYSSLSSKQQDIILAPLQWKTNEWLIFAGISGSVGLACHGDAFLTTI